MGKLWRTLENKLIRRDGKILRCDDCPCCACGASGDTVPGLTIGPGLFMSFVASSILSSNSFFGGGGGVCVWTGNITSTYEDEGHTFHSENIYASFQLNPDRTWSLWITGESQFLHPGHSFAYERSGDMGEGCTPIAIGPQSVYLDRFTSPGGAPAGAIGPFDFTLNFAP